MQKTRRQFYIIFIAVLIVLIVLLHFSIQKTDNATLINATNQSTSTPEWQTSLESYLDGVRESDQRAAAELERIELVKAQHELLLEKYNGAQNFVSQAMRNPSEIIAEPDVTAAPNTWIPYVNEEFGFSMMRPAMSMVVQPEVVSEDAFVRIMHASYRAGGVPAHLDVRHVLFGHEELLSYAQENFSDRDVMEFILEKDEVYVGDDVTIRTIEYATSYGLGDGLRILEKKGRPSLLISYTPVLEVVEMVEQVTLQ